MKKNFKKIILVFIPLILIAFAVLGLATAEIVSRTGDDKFCSSCHVMEPMVKSYKEDAHGGNNDIGFQAKCVDCHLSHENTLSYMVGKTVSGIKDVAVVTFTDENNVDFLEKRHHREEYVYDSGCLSCHKKILDKKGINPKAVKLHEHYLSKKGTSNELKCVSCHVTVGHAGLIRSELNKTKPEYDFGKDRLEKGLPMSEDEDGKAH